MFKNNVGSVDRAVRVIVGIALLAAYSMMPEASYRWALLIGIVPLFTGIFGTCPAYSLLGLSTCPMKGK